MIIKYPLYKYEEVCQYIGLNLGTNINLHHVLIRVLILLNRKTFKYLLSELD